MRGIPLPTESQQEAFVQHLCRVHSWYKHLPLREGGRFVVFVHADAGQDYPLLHPRLPLGNSPEGYRAAFGLLDYMWSTDADYWYRDGGEPVDLPEAIRQQCTFTLYPYVHEEFDPASEAEALAALRAGAPHPHREQVLKWWDAHQQMEALWEALTDAEQAGLLEAPPEGTPEPPLTPAQLQLRALERRNAELHVQLAATERARIWLHLSRLWDCLR